MIVRRVWYFIRHLWRVVRGGQLRFRLETFGVYYPELPYRSPWWRVSPQALQMMAARMWAYARWVEEMEQMRRKGGAIWWQRRRSGT